jgi:hypothetical protein
MTIVKTVTTGGATPPLLPGVPLLPGAPELPLLPGVPLLPGAPLVPDVPLVPLLPGAPELALGSVGDPSVVVPAPVLEHAATRRAMTGASERLNERAMRLHGPEHHTLGTRRVFSAVLLKRYPTNHAAERCGE